MTYEYKWTPLLGALLLALVACSPKSEKTDESIAAEPAEKATPAATAPVKTSKAELPPGTGHGQIFVDGSFLKFSVADDCTMTKGEPIDIQGKGQTDDGTDFQLDIQSSSVSVEFADGRSVSGMLPKEVIAQGQSISFEFEYSTGERPMKGLVFMECSL